VFIGIECMRRLPFGTRVNSSDWKGKGTTQTCISECSRGYSEATPTIGSVVGADGAFSDARIAGSCWYCSDLISVGDFGDASVETTCQNKSSGQKCFAFRAAGYMLLGKPLMLTCEVAVDTMSSVGFMNEDMSLATIAPTCVAQQCTINPPSKRCPRHECMGLRTSRTCIVSKTEGFDYFCASTACAITCGTDGAFCLMDCKVQSQICECSSPCTSWR
jgi:hypothetical protein